MFIKDGGYNSTNINKQLSPAQITPAMQATLHPSRSLSFKLSGHLGLVSRKMVKFNPGLSQILSKFFLSKNI